MECNRLCGDSDRRDRVKFLLLVHSCIVGSRGLFHTTASFRHFFFDPPTHIYFYRHKIQYQSNTMGRSSASSTPKKTAKTPNKRLASKVLSDTELAAKLLKKERQREAEMARVLKANAEHMKATRTSVPPVVPPRTKPFVTANHLAQVRVGERVKVVPNTSPGCNRPAGSGYVQLVTGTGAATVVSVKYDPVFGGLIHHGINYEDITIILFGHEFLKPNLATGRTKRAVPVVDEPAAASESDRRHPIFDLLERLNDGYSSGKPKGFHRKELGLGKPGSKQMSVAEKGRLFAEVMYLRQYLDGKDARQYFRQGADGRIVKRQSKYDPESIRYLVQVAWGKSNSYLANLEKVAKQKSGGGPVYCFPAPDESSDSAGFRSVIDDLSEATRRYTEPYLFAIAKCREQAKVDFALISSAEHGSRFSGWMKAYSALPPSEKAVWEMKRRTHLAMQPYIRDFIVDALERNPRESWRELEVDVNFWCSYSAIRRWLMSREGFRYYAERSIPLLTAHQMGKHLAFARHFRNNWGLGGGKFLLIMFDEKWFWGLVLRSYAKQVAELGIDPRSFAAYHRNHINKCMVVAFTAFAFVDSIENGGVAFKLGIYRAEAHKVAKQMVREAVRQADGRIKYCGPVVRRKGDLYLVDCAVTGCNHGTLDNPKFPLKALFENKIFPDVEALVGPGGQFEGHIPIFQGDNAGPHADAGFVEYVEGYCRSRGWHWEPQAPQMPHMNVLDLSVFPSMSKQHTMLCRDKEGLKVLTEDQTWDAAEEVWMVLENWKIASAYIQAYRIAKKVIAAKGNNGFLGNGDGIHVGVRRDFQRTENGMVRIDGNVIAPPAAA